MIQYKEPSMLGPIEVFKWWLHNLKKEKPHLKTPYYSKIRKKVMLTKKMDVPVISINKHELTYLRKKVLDIDSEIIELEQSDFKKWYFSEVTYKIFDLKKEVAAIEGRIKELEKANPEGKKTLMTYKLFCKIIEKYNEKVIKALVEDGESIKLWNNLGYLYILRKKKEDLFCMSNINWPASKKYKQELIDKGLTPKDQDHPEGKNWFQFYEDPDYLRVAWIKKYGVCKVPNNIIYAFYPTKSNRGITRKLINENNKNEYLRDKYITVVKKQA